MLPRYCKYTQLFRMTVPGGSDPAEIQRWHSIMGDTFLAMHHYCWGLMKTNRAMLFTRERKFRMHYLGDSIGEFNYVINNAPEDFVLLPEILTKKGENLIRLDRGAEGLQSLQRAIELNPDYWPPYAAISDYYKEIGDFAKAREWLENALSITPHVKALKLRMAKLDAIRDQRTTAPQSGMPQKPVKP